MDKNIDFYINKGKKLENINKHGEAIENYEKALKMADIYNENSFHLNMKLGELYRDIGNMDRCLEYYNASYEIAEKLDNVYFKIDALNKLAIENFSKGEIDISLNYINKSGSLLKSVDYNEGQLNNILYWLAKYYNEGEDYKGREIGKAGLELCKDDYPFYKGKILNLLASLFKDVTSANEDVHLLQLSLENFEKAGYVQGVLGVINNIGSVYEDKLQENEKALDVFVDLGERAKKVNHIEFLILSYINIGEVSLRKLDYGKAYNSYKKGLKEADLANLDHMNFFAYTGLIDTTIKLEKYGEAKKYFKEAAAKFLKNSNQGPSNQMYYNAVSSYFYAFGDMKNAKKYIKESMDTPINSESIVKWKSGLIYEFIRLRDSQNIQEINESLDGIKEVLLNYKNSEIIIDKVYDVIIELFHKEYYKTAVQFLNGYKELKVKESVKGMYIECFTDKINNKMKLEKLNILKEKAKDTSRNILIKSYCLLSEYYKEKKEYDNERLYINLTGIEIKTILNDIPKEYKNCYIKTYYPDYIYDEIKSGFK